MNVAANCNSGIFVNSLGSYCSAGFKMFARVRVVV